MLPLVYVDIQPPPPPSVQEIVLRRCSAVVSAEGPAACKALANRTEQSSPAPFASVVWTGQDLKWARVSLYDQRQVLRSQELRFEEQAEDTERWEAVGLLVAALVSSVPDAVVAVPEVEEPPPAPPPPIVEIREVHIPPDPHRWHLAVGGVVGPTTDGELVGFGATLQTRFAPPNAVVSPLLSVAFSRSTRTVELTSMKVSAGAALSVVDAAFDLLFRLEVALQRVEAQVARDASQDNATAATLGAVLGADTFIEVSPGLAGWLGIQATADIPRVELSIADDVVSDGSIYGWDAMLGLRFTL